MFDGKDENMFRYLKMKKMEMEIKLALYGCVSAFLKEKKELAALAERLYTALKEASPEELEDTFVKAIAGLVHEQAVREREGEEIG